MLSKLKNKGKVFTLFAALVALTACHTASEESTETFWIDNPTDEAITLKIDQHTLSLPPQSGSTFRLAAGKHQLTFNNEKREFMVKPRKGALYQKFSAFKARNDQAAAPIAIINPTQSEYLIYALPYQDEAHSLKEESVSKAMEAYLSEFIIEDEAGNRSIEKLPLFPTNALFIDAAEFKWDYGLEEALPESLNFESFSETMNDSPGFMVKRKLYRAEEFYRTVMKETIPTASPSLSLARLPEFRVTPEKVTSNCEALSPGLIRIEYKFRTLPQLPLGDRAQEAFQEFFEESHLALNQLQSQCTLSEEELTPLPEIETSFKALETLLKRSAYLLP